MEKSRFTTYHKMRLPHRRRRITVPGSFEDKGKYIRCWNCGFIVDVERDLGDPERSGNYETDAVAVSQAETVDGDDSAIGLDTLDMVGAMMENDPAGDAIADYYTPRLPEVGRGCPFCGCTNL